MSLGAKELFHTNFIAFLLESDEEALKQVRENLITLFFGHSRVQRVRTWREAKNLDLVILPAPKDHAIDVDAERLPLSLGVLCDIEESAEDDVPLAVVIEAKLKSIPTVRQLDDYNELLAKGVEFALNDEDARDLTQRGISYRWSDFKIKLDDNVQDPTIFALGKNWELAGKRTNRKRLATARGGVLRKLLLPGESRPELRGWTCVSWSKVLECITTGLPTGDDKSQLVAIVRDYAASLEAILKIVDHVQGFVRQAVNPSSNTTYRTFFDSITHDCFRPCRIRDLVGKIAMATLRDCLEGRLTSDLPDAYEGWKGPNDWIFRLDSYVHYSNQQPGLGLEWLSTFKPLDKKEEKKERRFSVGVQIQGTDYRHHIAASGKNKPEKLDDCAVIMGDHMSNLSWWRSCKAMQLYTKSVPISNASEDVSGGEVSGLYRFGENDFVYTKGDLEAVKVSEIPDLLRLSLSRAQVELKRKSSVNSSAIRQLNRFLTGQ